MADDPYAAFSAPAPSGVTDPYASFSAPVQPQNAPAPKDVPAGIGNPISNFFGDWSHRAAEGNAALHDYATRAKNPDAFSIVMHAAGVPTLNDVKGASAALSVGLAPFMAAADQIVGRPVGAVANVVNDAAKLAPGYEANPRAITDVANIVVPLADAVMSERALVQGAAKAGMSVDAYQAVQAAKAASIRRVAAETKAVRANNRTTIRDMLLPGSNDASVRRLAAQTLRQSATDPNAAYEALGAPNPEIIPGSQPTTAQLTGDMGLANLERTQESGNRELFNQRKADQNAARVNALSSVQSGGNPNELASAVRAHIEDLDTATQADLDRVTAEHGANVANTAASGSNAIQAATGTAQDAASSIGGTGNPETYGAIARQSVRDAEAAEKARFKGLFDAVDPDGNMVGNVAPVKQARQTILGEIPSTAKPMSGEEAAIFDTVGGMNDLSSYRDIQALRSRIAAEVRQQQLPTGDPQSLRHLTMLKSALQDNLATSISQQIANEAGAVGRGQIAGSDSTAARVQQWVNDWEHQRQAETGTGGTTGAQSTATGPASGNTGPNGAGLPPQGGPSGAPGDTGLSGNAQPISGDAVERLNAVNAEYAAFKAKYGQDPIKAVLARQGGDTLYRLPDARVAEKFFHPGPTGYTDMHALIEAVGVDRAMSAVQDFAASSLRRAAMGPDGIIDPVKYAKWVRDHHDALRAFPDSIKAKFAEAADAASQAGATAKSVAEANKAAAATAQEAITEASRARSSALKAAKEGAIGDILHLHDSDDIVKTVGSILRSKGAVGQMRRLVQATQGNPLATEGLRQAVVDHVLRTYISNTEAGTSGVNQIKADAFQTFMRQNGQALGQVLKPEEISWMRRVADDINRAKRSENAVNLTGRSNTVADSLGLKKLADKSPQHARTLLEGIGSILGGFGGPVGAGAGYFAANQLQAMRAAGIDRVDQLVTRAMLEPEVARALLGPPPVKVGTGSALRLTNALRGGSAVSERP